MADDRALMRLSRGIESLAAQVLGRPARVLWLEGDETAAAAVDRYLEHNPEARGRLELLAIGLPAPKPADKYHSRAADLAHILFQRRPRIR